MSVVLITGCSSGFGMVSAARLAAAGHTVYATMRDLAKKRDLLQEVATRGEQVHLLRLDVTDDDTIETVVARIEEDQGCLHVLVNNAGFGIGGFFEDLVENEVREQMETNFFGVQKVTRHALPLMRRTALNSSAGGSVKIINISSVQGRSPVPGLGAYAASKFALEGFSESLHFELHPFGIKVVLVEPGSYRTRIFTENSRKAKKSGDPDSPYAVHTRMLENRVRRMIKSQDEMGDPEDVAALIERIVKNPRPRLRYVIGPNARLRVFLRWVLPFSWFSFLMRKTIYTAGR